MIFGEFFETTRGGDLLLSHSPPEFDREDCLRVIDVEIQDCVEPARRQALEGFCDQLKAGTNSLAGSLLPPPKEFSTRFAAASPPGKIRFLRAMDDSFREEIRSDVLRLLLQETDSRVCRELVVSFPGLFPGFLKSSGAFPDSRSPEVVLALLEATRETLPELFPASFLREGVTAGESGEKTAPEELGGLLEMGFSQGSERRLHTLQKCALFPFSQVKPFLFSFLVKEKNPVLIGYAARILELNPDPEVPFHLYEMVGAASREKAGILKQILTRCCRVLEAGWGGGEPFSAYMQRLQDWISQRTGLRYVRQCLQYFQASDDPIAEYGEAVKEQLAKPNIRRAFQEALTWDIDDKLRNTIARLLGEPEPVATASPSPEKPLPETPVPVKGKPGDLPFDEKLAVFFDLPDVVQVRTLAAAEEKHKPVVRPILEKILENPQTTPRLMGTAIRTAIRLEMGKLSRKMSRALKMSDPSPLAAAIEYCGEYDIDLIIPYLGKYLKLPKVQVKIAALKVLKTADLPQALACIRSMLEQRHSEQQLEALTFMFHFDFRLVRQMLADFLSTGPEERVFQSALFLFKSNPEPENLPVLESLEKSAPVSLKPEIREVFESSRQMLLKLGVIQEASVAGKSPDPSPRSSPERPRADVHETPKRDSGGVPTTAVRTPPKPTPPPVREQPRESPREAVRESVKASTPGKPQERGKEPDWQKKLAALGQKFWLTSGVILVFVVIAMVVGFWQTEEGWEENEEGKAIAGSPMSIVGVVEKVDPSSDEILVKSRQGKLYILPIPVNSKVPETGTEIKAVILPYLLDKSGNTKARIISMQKQ